MRRSRPAGRHRLARLAALALPLALGACDWFTDFKDQPRLEPWEHIAGDTVPFRGNPDQSVPIYGSLVPAYRVSYNALPATVDSMSALPNPTPADSASLERGHKYYAINCAVCHGYDGNGNQAELIRKYGLAVSLQTPSARERSDGYIFGMIRNGRGLMPSYDRIEEDHRWDVVNYLKGLQGKLGRPVAQGPVAEPGEGWPKVPGATRSAPTRPVPHSALPLDGAVSPAPGTTLPGVPPAGGAARPGTGSGAAAGAATDTARREVTP